MNDLARDELGLHLTIFAEVECEKATAVSGGSVRRGFPIEAKLSYEDDEWVWTGILKCVYDWHGTKEVRVVMMRHFRKQ